MVAAHEHPFRWIMLLSASLLYACFGALMAVMAVLVEPISKTLDLDAFQMGTILGAWQFMYLVVSIPTGAVLDRYGLRPTLLIAGLTITVSALLRIYADGYFELLLAVLIFGLGGPLVSVGAPKFVARWFEETERGLAMGIYITSSGTGALLATVLTNSVIMPLVGGNWRAALAIYAVIASVCTLVWLVVIAHPLSKLGDDTSAAGSKSDRYRSLRLMLADPSIRIILMMALTMFFFIHAMHAWLPEILRAKGLSLVDAGYWAGLPAVVAIFAGFVVPRFALAHRRLVILAVVATIGIVSAAFLHTYPIILLAFCLAALGIPRSALVPIAMLMLIENKTARPDVIGSASGLFFTAGQIGGVLGPIGCGLALSLTGDFDAPLWLMVASMVALLFLILKMHRSGRVETDGQI